MNTFCLIPLGIFGLGGPELIVIVILVLLLFGGNKIPELMTGIGKGVKSFKDGVNEATEEIKKATDELEDKKDK